MVFTGSKPFNSYSGKYQYDHWNEAIAKGDLQDLKHLNILVKGNFMCFMNHLLEFKPGPTVHPWVPKKERKFGAKIKAE